MKTEHEVKSLRDSVQSIVDRNADRGVGMPQTVLEIAAFEQGRLSILKWMLADPVEPA